MLLILVVVCLAVAVTSCAPDPSRSAATATEGESPAGGLLSMRAERTEEPPVERSVPKRGPVANKAVEAINEYERQIAADPDSPENGTAMVALGNLYLQTQQDYAKAAQWYREFLNLGNDPENPQTGVIYAQLLRCYEAMEDGELIIALCREMLRVFPPHRQEYIYADKYIHGLDLTERIELPVEPEEPAPKGSPEAESEGAMEGMVEELMEGAAEAEATPSDAPDPQPETVEPTPQESDSVPAS